MRMKTLYPYQGRQFNRVLQLNNPDGTPAVNVFTENTILTANVWEGQNQPAIFQPAVTWYNGTVAAPQIGYLLGQVALSVSGSSTASLDPDGEYRLLIDAQTGGLTSPGWEGIFKVRATPGSTSPSPPDLVSYDYCLGMLSELDLTDAQIDALPGIIASASNLFREKCNQRYFDLRTLVEWHEVSLNGEVRLWQDPVQIVSRVQGVPNYALSIQNTSSSVQTSQAYFTFTGHDGGYGVNAKTATGIALTWTSNGTPANASVSFATYPTIGQLATAIAAVGSGWSAQVQGGYSEWASTELTGGFVAQGTSPSNAPNQGAQFNVLSDLGGCYLRPRSSILYVGQQYGGNALANRWGPGGEEMFGDDGQNQQANGIVKVTYQAGFTTIPAGVQNAVAQLSKYMLELLKQELLLASEKGGDYEYKLSPEMVRAVPKPVWEMIGAWKYNYA